MIIHGFVSQRLFNETENIFVVRFIVKRITCFIEDLMDSQGK